jgi:hypothetical protein
MGRIEAVTMKCGKMAIQHMFHCIPEPQLEDRSMASFAGLAVFQPVYTALMPVREPD